MKRLYKKTITFIAVFSLLVFTAAPVMAATSLTITGNGADSSSGIDFNRNSNTNVTQTNDAVVNNSVKVESNTGNNRLDDNTGGETTLRTGDADTRLQIMNKLNSNSATVDDCGACDTGDTEVLVEGNGSDSDNAVEVDLNQDMSLWQLNDATIENEVEVEANTGWNEADENTGGDTTIVSGDADTRVKVGNMANKNVARLGEGNNQKSSLSARILGNGADSDNLVDFDFSQDTIVTQWNEAFISNEIEVEAVTGHNEIDDSTGGEVALGTGDADVAVAVANVANFNAALLDCGCALFDVDAKISGNGADSDNWLGANLANNRELFQDNLGELEAEVEVEAETGYNQIEDSTGDVDGSDPLLLTGDSDTEAKVHNQANANQYGDDANWDWPWMGDEIHFSFDLGALFGR